MTRARLPGPPPSLSHPGRIIHLVSTPTDAAREDAAELARLSQLNDAEHWLYGAEGRAAAKSRIARHRAVGYSAEELINDTFANVWNRLERGPLPEGANIAAYCQRVMAHLLDDAFRGDKRRRDRHRDLAIALGVGDRRRNRELRSDSEQKVFDGGATERTSRRTEIDLTIRAAIDAIDASVAARAGAHTVVTALGWPAALPETHPVPLPTQGATELDRAIWVALWFIGRRDVFSTDGESSAAAARQRRARAAAPIRNAFEEAKALASYRRARHSRTEDPAS